MEVDGTTCLVFGFHGHHPRGHAIHVAMISGSVHEPAKVPPSLLESQAEKDT